MTALFVPTNDASNYCFRLYQNNKIAHFAAAKWQILSKRIRVHKFCCLAEDIY